jgi:outer membrane protein TolC
LLNDPCLPIDLPSALRLVNARSLDIAIAVQRIERARADHDLAKYIWLPTIQSGYQYYLHEGPIEVPSGVTANTPATQSNLGIGVYAIVTPSDAIFTALAARQVVRSTRADLTSTINDTTLAVATAYFNAQQARGELFGAEDTVKQAELLVARTKALAGDQKLGGIVLPLEVNRSGAELARRRQAAQAALERWRGSSAELVRILHLDPSLRIDPAEPPHLQVSLIDLTRPVDDLIPVALRNRPELASQQALVEAATLRVKAERLRPLVPSLIFSGAGPGGTTGSYWSGGQDALDRPYRMRADFNVQLVWTLQNLGLGNRSLIRGREADQRAAVLSLIRAQDRVAAEVVQAYADAVSAEQRRKDAESGLKNALESLDKNLQGMSQTRLIGGQNVLYVRPQEVVAAVTALASAYADFYGAANDYNRSQFLLFRAMGYPVSLLGNDPANLPPIRPGHDLKRTDPGTH